MFKYLWSRGQNPTSEREKLQKELFSFSKNVQYGFPHKPVSMDWDPHLQLLVIVTKPGTIRIFGQPGVELTGRLASKELSLLKVLFLPAQGRLVTLAGPGNVLHFWEIEDTKIEKVKYWRKYFKDYINHLYNISNSSSDIIMNLPYSFLDKDYKLGHDQVRDQHSHHRR